MVQQGELELRKEVVDKAIKGVADATYTMKQAVSIETTGAWKNYFVREASTVLTGDTLHSQKGLARGENFPQAVVEWEKVPTWLEKHGLEENIFWEDILTNDINVQKRVLFKIGEGVAKSVDDEIFEILSEAQSPTNIHTFTISLASQQHWDQASCAIIDDLMRCKQMIGTYNYPTSNLMGFINQRDHRSMVKFVTDSGAQFDKLGDETARNGRVQGLVGIKLIVSNVVPASNALVLVPKLCGTWKQAVPLTTNVESDPFKSTRIRAVEMGVTQLTDPKAVCLIQGTEMP